MPGVSLKWVLSKKETNKIYIDSDEAFLKTLKSGIYNDSYKSEVLLKKGPCLLACTKYAGYPVNTFENGDFWFCLEGRIYNKDKINDEVIELLNHIFMHKSITERDKKIISDQLLQTDGDFIIYALDKRNGDFVIINDILGRLPLYYYYKDDTELIVSRELPFISSLTHDDIHEGNRFDRMAMAQYLLIGFPLGNRTLLTNIFRFEPASILRIFNNSEVNIENIYRLNFENTRYADQRFEANSQELVSLFTEACKNRVSRGGKNIICLSGGFDSRGVLACFHKNSIPGYGVTFFDPEWTPAVGSVSEAEVAEQLAKSANFDWENYDFINPKPEDLLKLLEIKNGFPYLANRYLLPSLDKLNDKHDSIANIIFTGHGGEIIRSSPFRTEIKSLDFLVNLIVKGKRSFSLTDVADLVQLKETEIVDEIRNILSSYPEGNIDKKYLHFLYYESAPRIFFESEDILRHYFWTASPYYSIPFFYYAVNCPEENKSFDALYKQFIGTLSNSALEISTSNWGCSVVSSKYKMLQFIYSVMWKYRKFYKIILSVLSIMWKYPKFSKIIIKKDNRRHNDNSKIIACIREQVNDCHNISNYLSRVVMEKILDNYDNFSDVGIHNLFDITLLMERMLCNKSIIGKYFNK